MIKSRKKKDIRFPRLCTKNIGAYLHHSKINANENHGQSPNFTPSLMLEFPIGRDKKFNEGLTLPLNSKIRHCQTIEQAPLKEIFNRKQVRTRMLKYVQDQSIGKVKSTYSARLQQDQGDRLQEFEKIKSKIKEKEELNGMGRWKVNAQLEKLQQKQSENLFETIFLRKDF